MSYVKKNEKLEPLSEIEKAMAEKYHNIVYSFLHKNNYSVEECYDIVVIGYLKGIQKYCRRTDLQELYSVVTMCEYRMRTAMFNHFRAMRTSKRKPTGAIISLDAEYGNDGEKQSALENCIGENSFEDDVIADEAVSEILNSLSERQRQIVILKLNGYTHNEICLQLHVGRSAVSEEMKNIKIALSERCGC